MYPDFGGKHILDLYAGSGSLGLEALSRGAAYVDFVEFASPAIGIILQNIQKLGCGEFCHVHRKRVEKYLAGNRLDHDVIFLDPPYDKALVSITLSAIFSNQTLNRMVTIIVEHSRREELPAEYEAYIFRQKQGKASCFSILSLF